jgi:hypothetical protein
VTCGALLAPPGPDFASPRFLPTGIQRIISIRDGHGVRSDSREKEKPPVPSGTKGIASAVPPCLTG